MVRSYKYLIVGGGMTGSAAAQGIRQVDSEGTVGMVGAEENPPYNRPPLTKGLWKGKPIETVFRQTSKFNVDLHLGHRAVELDPANKRVLDDHGDEYIYNKLLLATGGTPKSLQFDMGLFNYYRTINDYYRLREYATQKRKFAVIGAGFIGSEITAALTMNGRDVTMIFPEEAIGARTFPGDLSDFLNDFYREKGVELLPDTTVKSAAAAGGDLIELHMDNGQKLVVDGVVAGIGIRPNTELAERAGLKVDNGILVDEYTQSSQPDIYAAGDVANFYNPALEVRMRVEHEDNANNMGLTAGKNMAGRATPYAYLPFFYSDLFELGYEAVGDLNPQLEVVADWQEPYKKGVLYYLKHGRVRGVLLWDVWGQVDSARKLITEKRAFEPIDLKDQIGVK